MAEATLNGFDVTAGTLTWGRTGAWVLDVDVDTETALAGAVPLAVGTNGPTFAGTVFRGANWQLRWSGRIVGGGGGLRTQVPARQYRGVPARTVVSDLLTEVGEQLDPSSAGLDAMLACWARRGSTAAEALALLVDALGTTWSMNPAGQIRVGDPAWSAFTGDAELLEENVRMGTATYAMDLPVLCPGATLGGQRVSAVVYTFEAQALRAEVWFEP